MSARRRTPSSSAASSCSVENRRGGSSRNVEESTKGSCAWEGWGGGVCSACWQAPSACAPAPVLRRPARAGPPTATAPDATETRRPRPPLNRLFVTGQQPDHRQILADDGTFFAATNGGDVVAFTADGYIRWRTGGGQLAHLWPARRLQDRRRGVIDASPARSTWDAFGRLHTLDVAAAPSDGYPDLPDFRRELVGCLTRRRRRTHSVLLRFAVDRRRLPRRSREPPGVLVDQRPRV